jgi:hypothetical protein
MKGRYFYISDLALNLVGRMLLLPVLAYLIECKERTGFWIDVNAGSSDWKKLYNFLTRFEKVLEGDFKSMDLSHSVLNDPYAKFIYHLCLRLGYTHPMALASARVTQIGMHYILLMEGNLFLCEEKLNSGRFDTIIVNSVDGEVIVRYPYAIKYPEKFDVPDWSNLRNPGPSMISQFLASCHAGDDVLLSRAKDLKMEVEDFVKLIDLLGYVLTNPNDKNSPPALSSIDKVTFLKRSFVKEGERVFAPLALESIYRSLSYYAKGPSKVTEEERNRGAVQSAIREFFLHGQAKFEQEKAQLELLFPEIRFPTYAFLLESFDTDKFTTWESEELDPPLVLSITTLKGLESRSGYLDMSLVQFEASPIPRYTDSDKSNEYLFTATINPNSDISNDILPAPAIHIGGVSLDVEQADYSVERPPVVRLPEVELAKFFARPRLIFETDTSVTTVAQIDVFLEFKSISSVADVLSKWAFFRGNPVISVSVTGSPALYGLFRVYAYPYRTTSFYSFEPTTQYSPGVNPGQAMDVVTSQLPHVDIDLSMAKTYELKLEYPSPRTYISTTSGEDWVVGIYPINPAASTFGVTPPVVAIQVYCHYEKVELNGIIRESGRTERLELGKHLDAITEYARLVGGRFKRNPLSTALGLGSDFAAYMGLSRMPAEPFETNLVRPVQNSSLVSGQPDFCYTLGADPSLLRPVSRNVFPMQSENETDIHAMVQRPSMYQSHVFGATPSLPTPALAVRPDTIITDAFHNVWNTLGFFTMAFEQWTGDMILSVQVVSSPLIRMRYLVVIVPPNQTAPSTPADALNGTMLSTVVETAGSTIQDIVIPFQFIAPFVQVSTSITILDTTGSRIRIFPLIIPVGPSSTPQYPYVNLWLRASSNFCLGVPTINKLNNHTIEYESGQSDASKYYFGELITTTEQLAHRAVLGFVGLPFNELPDFYFNLPVQPRVPLESLIGTGVAGAFQAASQVRTGWTFMSYFSSAYIGESGSVRLFMLLSDTSAIAEVSTGRQTIGAKPQPPCAADSFDSSRGSMLYDNRSMPAIEVRAPDRSGQNFRSPNAQWSSSGNFEVVSVRLGEAGSASPSVSCLWAAGDDYMMGGYLRSPYMKIRIPT